MLPSIHTDNGRVRHKRVLVGRRDDIEAAALGMVAEPAPTTALDTSEGRVELALHLFQAAKVTVNGSAQLTTVELTATLRRRGKVLPEQRVVNVATAVEVEASLKRDGLLHITLRKRLSRLGLEVVETVDVSLVVLGVVHFHDLT